MFEKLLPKQYAFFDEFDRLAKTIVEGAHFLQGMLEDLSGMIGKVEKIKEIEHEGDSITHRTIELLHTTFITPIDRDQIYTLITRMDDILDAIEAAGIELQVYDINTPTQESQEMARLLVKATEGIQEAVRNLRDLTHRDVILSRCVEVKGFENQGDAVLRGALGRLFREQKDALVVMKWKEIYENLEAALDRCEDVANVVEGVVLENA